MVAGFTDADGLKQRETEERVRIKFDAHKTPLANLELTARAYNCLKRAGCKTAWDVIILARDAEKLASLDGVGKRTLRNILDRLDGMFPGWDNRWEVQK